jgi:hypothetical protein
MTNDDGDKREGKARPQRNGNPMGLPEMDDSQKQLVSELGQEGLTQIARLLFSYDEICGTASETTRTEFRSLAVESARRFGEAATRYLSRQLDETDRRHASHGAKSR